MVFSTALTRKLGIALPIVQGGMQWVGYAELAATVGNAGGLGILTALTQRTPEGLHKEIQAGITILHKCTIIRHVKLAIKLGVDFLSIDGLECTGHVREHDITSFILLSRARQEIKVPFITLGGFVDGHGLIAALELGAEGINMADENDTKLVLCRWRNTQRLFRNGVMVDTLKVEKSSTSSEFSEGAPFISGKRGREVFLNRDPEYGVWTASQSFVLIHDIPTYGQLLNRIKKEAMGAMDRIRSVGI
ncbi:hypothetical protein BJX68DRAFT_258614 [Aspergillus pseudodeflectus]|uniref:Nitronate monooxygenase domain-containing protein n=1 Tax=Aspergillus pseudodeflectus TaxID=176178 RepID=A0ABR4JK23_9EURO